MIATNVCTQCTRSFRTQSGLAWHLRHVHTLEEEATPESVNARANPQMQGVDLVSAKVDDLEDLLSALSTFVSEEISGLSAAIGLDNGSTEIAGDRLERLEDQLIRVELTMVHLSEMPSELESQERNFAALGRRISRVEMAVSALCGLVVEHDPSGTGHQSLLNLVMQPSPPDIQKKAQEALRQYLIDGAVGLSFGP